MARTVKDAKLESSTARAKLKISGVPYWRAMDPGLHIGYRKGRTGGKWVARWYLGARQYHHETLDGIPDDRGDPDNKSVLSFAQAQQRVRDLFGNRHGKKGGPLTVKAACESYIEFLRGERKTADDAEGRLRKHVYPDLAALRHEIEDERGDLARRRRLHARAAANGSARAKDRLTRITAREAEIAQEEKNLPKTSLGSRLVTELMFDDIERWKWGLVRRSVDDPEVVRRSKDTANRVLTMLKAALNRAWRNDKNHIPSDAEWRKVKPFDDVGRPRDVFLDVEQSNRLINVCSGAFRNLVTAALLTGARPPGELAPLRVRHFRADLGTLSIVDGKTGERDIVLTAEAVRWFSEITAGRAPDALLLPKDDGSQWGENHHLRPMRRAAEKAKLPAGTTIYTCRHSHASQALLNGMNLQLLAENMGTSVRMIEKHYGKFLAASRRELIEASGFKLGLKAGNVKKMQRR